MLTDPYSAPPIRLPAIRYSEKIGLLHKTQRISGQRRYEDGVFNYLAVIDVAKRAGFRADCRFANALGDVSRSRRTFG